MEKRLRANWEWHARDKRDSRAEPFRSRLAIILLPMLLSGCASTEADVLKSRIALYDQAAVATRGTLEKLRSEGAGEYGLKAFISYVALNKALRVVDSTQLKLPGDEKTSVTLRSARLEALGALPVVAIEAQARRGKLSADVEIKAVLLPAEQAGRMKLGLISFVPRVRWYFFEFTKIKFARDLLSVKAAELVGQMPTLSLPIERTVRIGGAASTRTISFLATSKPANMTMAVGVPSTAWSANVTGVRYFFLADGIHMLGRVE